MGTEADYLTDQSFDRKHGEYGDPQPCPDCDRLKALVGDVWRMYKPEKNKMYSGDLEMEARIKQEGII
jgi:hypothetical protein